MPTFNTNHQRGTLALLRDLVPNRRLSTSEGLRIAELQAARFRRLLGIDGACFPNEAFDLPRIRVEHDVDLPSSGMTFWNGSAWIIVLNPTEPSTRQRFSLMHESKHIIDHSVRHRLYGPEARRDDPQAERIADYFAACVLMPKLYVKRHWGRGPRTISSMARVFEVSPTAMKYRLDQLGLLDEPRRCTTGRTAYWRSSSRVMEVAA